MVGPGTRADEPETPAEDAPESFDEADTSGDGERPLQSTSVPSDIVTEWNVVYNVFGFKFI